MTTPSLSPDPLISGRTLIQDRWDRALKLLSAKDADELKLDLARTDYLGILQDIHDLAIKKKELCIQKAWKYKKSDGATVIIRDLFEKILVWVQKVKEVGDVIVSYDPGHAALPWAAVRFLLTIAVEDSQTFGVLVEGVEQISRLITQCKVLESLYPPSVGDDTGFDQALLELYVAILTFQSHAIHFYQKRTSSRLVSAIKLPSNGLQDDLENIWIKHRRVVECTNLIEVKYNRQLGDRLQQVKDLLRQLEQPIVRSATILQDYQDSLELKERENILRWLSTVPYRKHHKLKRGEHLAGSCEWLLNSTDYNQWKDSSVSSILWLNGIAGCGKSVLTSSVIESLCRETSSMGTAAPIAYFYCSRNTAEPERANPEEVLRSILEQASSDTANLPIRKSVVEIYKEFKKENRGLPPQERLSLDETTKVLLEILEVDPIYIVIDALDECNPNERYDLIDALKTIITRSASVVKVFISSRRDSDIVSQLEGSPCISIQPSHISKDIMDYVQIKVSDAIEKRRIARGKVSPSTKQRIVDTLIEGAQGMFRWVSLQIQQLCNRVKVEKDIDIVLRNLPKSLAESYNIVYQDIMSMPDASRKLAIRTLQVLLSARRTLNEREMLAAAAIDIDTNDILASSMDDLLDVCCNLVIFDEEVGMLRFAHLSVREYLESAHIDTFGVQSRELFITNRSLYVFLCQAHDIVLPENQRNDISLQNESFENYAAKYWAVHCKLGHPEVADYFLGRFIGKEKDRGCSKAFKKWVKSTDAIMARREDLESLLFRNCVTKPPSILFVACIYGLTAIITTLLSYEFVDWNQRTKGIIERLEWEPEAYWKYSSYPDGIVRSETRYPLVYAAEKGFEIIVKMILTRNLVYYTKGNPGHDIATLSLHKAVAHSQTKVVRVLVDYGIDVNTPLKSSDSTEAHHLIMNCLQTACRNESEDIVMTLLDHGASTDNTMNFAAFRGNIKIITMLANCSADLNARHNFHELNGFVSPIETAIYSCQFAAADTLCSLGVDIKQRSLSGGTLLHAFAERSHTHDIDQDEDSLRYLISKGLDVKAVDKDQETALHKAARHYTGNYEYSGVEPLIDAGTPLDMCNREGKTALSIAAEEANEDAVRALLSNGADSSITDNYGHTALEMAKEAEKIVGSDPWMRKRSASLGYIRYALKMEKRSCEAIIKLLSEPDDASGDNLSVGDSSSEDDLSVEDNPSVPDNTFEDDQSEHESTSGIA